MSLYQIVPYLVRINVAGDPEEFRKLGDIDGKGLTLADAVSRATHAHKGQTRGKTEKSDERARTLTITAVSREGESVVVSAETGRTGIRSNVVQKRGASKTVTAVLEDDLTLVPLRHVFAYNKMSRVGLLLAERAGQHGAITDLRDMIISTFSEHTDGLVMRITPAMSSEAMDAWAAKSRVKGIEIRKVDPSTGGAMLGVKPVTSISIRAPRNKFWSFLRLGGKNMTQEKTMAMVLPYIPGASEIDNEAPEAIAAKLIDEGWSVAVDLRADNKTRKVQLETKAGITLSYPATLEEGARGRPDDKTFYEACADACENLSESFDDFKSLKDRIPRSPQIWSGAHSWKAVWGEQIDDS